MNITLQPNIIQSNYYFSLEIIFQFQDKWLFSLF